MEPHARGGACSNRPGRALERTLDVCRFLIGLVENLGDVLPGRFARFRRNFLGKLPQFLVLGGGALESLVRLRCGQGEDIRYRLAAQEMGEEIDRGGGIGVRDLDDLEPVVGGAPAIARIGLTQRFRHLSRRGLDLLAAFLCAGDPLLGKLAERAGQADARDSKQRHPETMRSVQSGFLFTFTHGTITFLKRNHFPRRWLASRELVEAESCPASVFGQLLDELQPSPDATMFDEKGCCPFDSRLSIKIFSRMSIHTIVIYRNGAVHNGDIARGGKGRSLFSASSEGQRSRRERHYGSFASVQRCPRQVRSSLNNRHMSHELARQFRATSRLMHRNHDQLYSITSSARPSNDWGTVRPSIFCCLEIDDHLNFRNLLDRPVGGLSPPIREVTI